MRIGDKRSGEEYSILRLISQEAADKMRDINSRIRSETGRRAASNAFQLGLRFRPGMSHMEMDAYRASRDPNHVEGLVITDENASTHRRIIELPSHMKEGIVARARSEFSRGFGVGTARGGDELGALMTSYVRELPVQDRLSAMWTLQQVFLAEHDRIHSAIRREMPGWNPGQRVPAHILNPILNGGGSFDVEA